MHKKEKQIGLKDDYRILKHEMFEQGGCIVLH